MIKQTIEFKIPGCYIEAKFEQYKNKKWKFSVHNPSNDKSSIVAKSIDTDIVKETISMMMGQEFREDYKENIEILRKGIIECHKKRSNIQNKLNINQKENANIRSSTKEN